MVFKKISVILLIVIFANGSNAQVDLCNVCDPDTNYACFSDHQYFECDDNGAIDISTFATCASGVCDSTVDDAVLGPCSSSSPPSCPEVSQSTVPPITTTQILQEECNVCNLDTGFACFSDRQYFECDDNGAIDISSFATCSSGVCDFTIDGDTPCSTNSSPSCPEVSQSTITTTTTPAPTTFTPTGFCTNRAAGRYPYGSGCTLYIYCYLNSGAMSGALYGCSGEMLFNPTTLQCETGFVCPA